MTTAGGDWVTVSRVVRTLWRRELATILSVRESVVSVGLTAALVVGTALSILLWWLIGTLFSGVGIGDSVVDARPLLRLVFAGVLLGASTYQIILSTTVPNRTTLDNLLALTPVGRRSRSLGQLVPLLAIGFVCSLLLGFPSLAVVSRLVAGEPAALVGLTGIVWVTALATIAVPAVFVLARTAARRLLHLPSNYALLTATVVTAAACLAVAGRDLVPRQGIGAEAWWQLVTPTRALTDVLVGTAAPAPGAAWVTCAAWSLAALGLAAASFSVRDAPDHSTATRLLVGAAAPRSRPGTLLWTELVQIVRLPQFVVVLLVAAVGTVALPLAWRQPELSAVADQVAGVFVLIPAALGMYSFGTTHRSHWLLTLHTGDRRLWIAPKATAAALVTVVVTTPFFVVMAFVGMPASRLLDLGSLAAVMICAGLLCGVLVPFIASQNLSATVTSATTVLTWAVIVLVVRWLDGQLALGMTVPVTLLGGALVLAAYVVAARGASRSDRVVRT